MARDLAEYFILDALADDVESLEQILPAVRRAVEYWDVSEAPSAFGRDRIVGSLIRLIREESVAALVYTATDKALVDVGNGVVPSGSLDDYWFRLTGRGRVLHQSWEPPPERVRRGGAAV